MVEMLVVIMLLGLLGAFAWPLIHADTPQQRMQQACERLSSLMAMCRAQAMLNGHPVEVAWQAPADDPKGLLLPTILHEADPIESPGEFKPMAASWASDPVLPSNVQIRLIQPGNFDLASLTKTQGRFELPADPSLQTVQFHPDGTADPAVFVLTTKLPEGSEQEELQGWVILDGVSGLAQMKKPPTAEQFDAMLKAQAALPDLQLAEKAVEVSQESPAASLLSQNGITKDQLGEFLASMGGSGATGGGAVPNTSAGGNADTSSGGTAATNTGGNRGTSRGGRNNNNNGAPAGNGGARNNNNPPAGNGGVRNSNNPPAGNNGDASNGDDPNNPNNNRSGSGRNGGGRNNSGGGNRGSGRSR